MLNEPSIKRKRSELCALLALMGMLIWFCDEMIFSGKIPVFRDLISYFYPIKHSVAESFRAGELPLWDRHMAGGFPIMAGFQSAVFYPPSIIFLLLPFYAGIQATFVIHYGLALFGSYLLFRSWKYPIFVALIGAILFTFGGTVVSLTNLLNHFQSAVWLPCAILLWERVLKSGRWSDFAIFSVVLTCQLLAGSPEIFMLSLSVLVLDAARMKHRGEISSAVRAIAILAGAGAVLIGLGMVQLLPTGELIMQSRRDQAIPAIEALAWSLRPSALIGFFLPTLEADTSLALGASFFFSSGAPFLLSPYLGIVALLGWCGWLWTANPRERLWLIGLLAVSLVLALGSFTPVYPFLYEWLPVLRGIRFPEKFFFLTYALLIFAAVKGLHELLERGASRSAALISAGIAGAWMIVYGISRWDPLLLVQAVHHGEANILLSNVNTTKIAALLFGVEKQIAISLVLAVVLAGKHLGWLRPALFRTLIVLVPLADISLANKPLNFLQDKNIIAAAPRIAESPPPDHGRYFYYPAEKNMHPSYVSVHGAPTFVKASEIALTNLLPNAGMLYGFSYFQDIDALARRTYTDFLVFINRIPPDRQLRLLRAINVRNVVSFQPLKIDGLRLVREYPEHYSRLYEIADPVPRAYIASEAIHEVDPKSILERLSSADFDPTRQVIVNAPAGLQGKGGATGAIAITRYENTEVEISARLDQPGILVLADSFDPGWKVFVNSNEQEILRANHFFRGVQLPAGGHRVKFVYDPVSFKIGLLVSLVTTMLLIAVPLANRMVRRVALSRRKDARAPASLSRSPEGAEPPPLSPNRSI